MTGETLSHYHILDELGRGGMGIVYKAEDTKLGRIVAVKVLPPHAVSDETELARFTQEARAAASLNHPNIATVHEIDDEDGTSFIVMEFVDGPSLKDEISAGPMSASEVARIALQILSGLAAAHELGIVHRDIKPANIMLTRRREAKIMDFGLAKLAGQATLTNIGMTVGTAAYMSPEQARGEVVDGRSDLFSAGVLMYEMLTGQRAFKGEYEQAVIYALLNVDPEPMASASDDIPPGLERIVFRALSKNPAERYQTADEFLSALKSIHGDTDNVDQVNTQSSQTVTGVVGKQSRKPAYMIGTMILAMIAVIAMYLLLNRSSPQGAITLGRAQQITYLSGMEIDPVISPNGEMIAFSAGALGHTEIFVKQFAGGRTISLTEDIEGAQRWPQWSPDGQRIAFESENAIFVIPALGGTSRRIIEVEPGSIGLSPTWSPDGSEIAFVERNGIYIHQVAENETTLLKEAFLPHSLKWSPDGTRIAFVSDNQRYIFGALSFANVAPSSINVLNIQSGEIYSITGTESLNISPVWTPDGRSLLFVSNRDGTRDIYVVRVKVAGSAVGSVEKLTTGLNAHTISLSPDGTSLAYSVLSSYQNIWSLPIPTNDPVSSATAEPVTSGHQVIESMGISRDGDWIVYDSDLAGSQDIYKKRLPDGEPIQLTSDPADDFTPSWSFDGSEIAFHSFRDGNREIYRMDSEGRVPERLTNTPSQDRVAVWSPDGKSIVYFSDASGTQQLYMITRPSDNEPFGPPKQLTTTGGLHSNWAPDGKSIAYITGSRQHMMSFELYALALISPTGGEPRILLESKNPSVTPQPEHVSWSTDGQTLYYTAFDSDGMGSIWSMPSIGGTSTLLVRFDDPSRPFIRHEFATGNDRFYFSLSEFESDVWVIAIDLE